MGRPPLEVADIFRLSGEEYRTKHRLNREQHRAMRAIQLCRIAALGGHVDECDRCGQRVISYNSCRNRHCPKCQSLASARWLAAREEELLPVPYFQVVFTLPQKIAALAYQNKRALYSILFKAVSATLIQIAADPKHLGVRIGFLAILHTWGQTLNFHPHIHCVVAGGGLSIKENRWISCPKKNLFLSVAVLSKLFRGKFLSLLKTAYRLDKLRFYAKPANTQSTMRIQQISTAALPNQLGRLLQTSICESLSHVALPWSITFDRDTVLVLVDQQSHFSSHNHLRCQCENRKHNNSFHVFILQF
jgi:hypothetical protein